MTGNFFLLHKLFSCTSKSRCRYSRFCIPSLTGNVFLLISCAVIYFHFLEPKYSFSGRNFFPVLIWQEFLFTIMSWQEFSSCYKNYFPAAGREDAHITDILYPFSYRKCIFAYFLCSNLFSFLEQKHSWQKFSSYYRKFIPIT